MLTLTGDNSYNGDTTISAGTLQLGNGGTTGSVARDIVDNGALVFNRSDAAGQSGAISIEAPPLVDREVCGCGAQLPDLRWSG